MKVYLMNRNRDFDPQQPFPVQAADLMQDLDLDLLFNAMAQGDKYILNIVKQAVINGLADPDSIVYRQDVLKDCLNNPEVIRAIYQIPIEALERKQHSWLGIFVHSPGRVLESAVEMMFMLMDQLKKLMSITAEYSDRFTSEGFVRFFSMLKQELDDAYFEKVNHHLRHLKFDEGALISADLGRANEGANFTLRLPNPRRGSRITEIFQRKSPSYSFSLHPRDEAGARALGDIKDEGVYAAAVALEQACEHIESFFNVLRAELAFYIGCINLRDQLARSGNPIAFPIPFDASQRVHQYKSLYDACLALAMKSGIVANDLDRDSQNLFIITGANQGGKSTYLRSIGLAQLMMQAGMFVPAEAFSANVCPAVFTHFRRKEDSTMKSGKLDEELSRMSAIADSIGPNSLILFNESFAATNEREGSEIARQIVSALTEQGIKVFFVTHMYEFARYFYEKRRQDTVFLRAERGSGGKRTFKLAVGEPLPTGFGQDVYQSVFFSQKTAQS